MAPLLQPAGALQTQCLLRAAGTGGTRRNSVLKAAFLPFSEAAKPGVSRE